MTITSPPAIPPTTIPCPSWCTDKPGHGYDCLDDDGAGVRFHIAFLGEGTLGRPELSADVVQHAAFRDGAEQRGPVEIQVWIGGDRHEHAISDPAAALSLAAALTAAAPLLERIQSGELS